MVTGRPLDLHTASGVAIEHLCSLQLPDGRWEGEMVWNTMLLSQYVLTHRLVGRWPLPEPDIAGILRHFETTQLPDGSWPAHREGPPSVYLTALAYVTLRVLGQPADAPSVARARDWWLGHGSITAVPSWGRLWLALLGLYGYDGINPVPPELFLLPPRAPMHPDRLYCHTRYTYSGLAYLYGSRAQFDLGPLGEQLRRELYGADFASVDFAAARGRLTGPDVFVPPHPILRAAYTALAAYERWPVKSARRAALRRCAQHALRGLEASRGHGVSPVSALLGCLVLARTGAPRAQVLAALAALEAWRWEDEEEGIRVVGARSSSWDTSFAMRALAAAPSSAKVDAALARGYRWLLGAQACEELPAAVSGGRSPINGGWCFSDGTHRWPVSDCTAEALSAILAVHHRARRTELEQRIPDERIHAAVGFILARQNRDGGFGTYENARASGLLERFNPSEMYADCMTEASHVECTASCVSALARFRADCAGYQGMGDVNRAVRRGVAFLRSRQRADGSYPAAWGIAFTYSAFFVLDALRAAGVDPADKAVTGATGWLIKAQKADGGWGEHHSSCRSGKYVEHPQSQAAMTAWALLALTPVAGTGHPAVRRGLGFLASLMEGSAGGWPRQAPSGVFFKTAVLDYRLYKDVFPAWALAVASAATTG
ncbi:MAG TPA: prenyltransferase/squalene oxidase repeat-containing protein [Streptosporangiaceae bacterium]|nr:prenyltransferase/squalene oxidase repeat-containing protein [Streptosporangiaceae bacterium]